MMRVGPLPGQWAETPWLFYFQHLCSFHWGTRLWGSVETQTVRCGWRVKRSSQDKVISHPTLQMKLSPLKCHLEKPAYMFIPHTAITLMILGHSAFKNAFGVQVYFPQMLQNCLLPWSGYIFRIRLPQAHLVPCLVTKVGNCIGNTIFGQKWSVTVNQWDGFFGGKRACKHSQNVFINGNGVKKVYSLQRWLFWGSTGITQPDAVMDVLLRLSCIFLEIRKASSLLLFNTFNRKDSGDLSNSSRVTR